VAKRRDYRGQGSGDSLHGQSVQQRLEDDRSAIRFDADKPAQEVRTEGSLALETAPEQTYALLQDVVGTFRQDAADEVPAAVLIVGSESCFDADVERPNGSPHKWTAASFRPQTFFGRDPVRPLPRRPGFRQ
jgi:hypothetical protein